MSNLDQASEDLFFKLRNRFPKISMGDEMGQDTVDPEKARFFSFVYKDKDSERPYGRITCSLIDGSSLKVFFDTAITNRMLPEDKNYWYQFLRELRRMAKSHMLNFDVRDITKDTLSRQDLQYMTKLNPEKKKIKENLEESRVLWQRKGKVSEGNLNNVRIHVVHNERMLENPNNRLLKVDRIYLVNESGEKFLLPFKSVSGAKAMANHVSRGGNPYDPQGQLIGRAVSEMRNLSRFTTATRTRTFEAAEAVEVITAAQQMKESIKRHLNRLSNNSRNFAESLEALSTLISENTDDLSEVKGWFTQQTYNENLDNYLASAAGAYRKLKENQINGLDEAANTVEKKILDPKFKLVLKADAALDKLMTTRQYTDTTAMLTAILGDIANRLVTKDGDDVANFAALMGDLVSSEGEAFGQKSEPEYNRDKKLSIVLAQKYLKELNLIRKNPKLEKDYRVNVDRSGAPKKKSKTESELFAEEIMSIGEEASVEDITDAISHRLMNSGAANKMLRAHGLDKVLDAIHSVAQNHVGAEEIGTSDVSAMVNQVMKSLGMREDAVSEEEVEESGLQYYTGKKKYGKEGMAALAKAGREGASQEELGAIKDKYMKKEDAVSEEETDEGIGKTIAAGALAAGVGAGAAAMQGDDKPMPYMVKPAAKGGYEIVLKRNSSNAIVNFADKEKAMAWIKDKMAKKEDVTDEATFPGAPDVEMPSSGATTPKTELQQQYNQLMRQLRMAKNSAEEDNLIKQITVIANKLKAHGDYAPIPNKLMNGALEEEPNEGNEFSGALAAARASGKDEFEVDGKTYKVKENTEETKMSKTISEMRKLAGLPLNENYIYAQEEDDTENAPDTVPHDGEPSADDKAEYDQEGRMAKNDLAGAADAAKELESILQDDENLPEWVQAKITKALDYLDTARDYMKHNDVEYTDENVEEAAKPDFLDVDKDGDKEEPFKKAVKDKEAKKEKTEESVQRDLTWLQAVAGIVRK